MRGMYESDLRNRSPILEDKFSLKHPVAPYRSFRKSGIENTSEIENASDRVRETQIHVI